MPPNKLPDQNLELERRNWNGQGENMKRIEDLEDKTQILKLSNSKKELQVSSIYPH